MVQREKGNHLTYTSPTTALMFLSLAMEGVALTVTAMQKANADFVAVMQRK